MATSSTEAEYYALLSVCKEAIWFKHLLEEVCLRKDCPVPVFCDNKSTIFLATNENFSKETCHINLNHHFVKNSIRDKLITLGFKPTSLMLADGLTKALKTINFKKFVSDLNLVS